MLITSKQYQNFISGRFFYEGLKIAAGILVPAFLFGYFDMLHIGLVLSLGALAVSTADAPGPMHHRYNAMAFTIILVTIVSITTGLMMRSEFWLGIYITIAAFIFSMFTIYGQRTSSIGIAALIIIILSLDFSHSNYELVAHSLYLMLGGVWYMLFSLTLYSIRPYKIIQQVLGDYLMEVADYYKVRSGFYKLKPDVGSITGDLVAKQVELQQHQVLLSELIFKTRTLVRESTNTTRRLMKMYVDTNTLFESIMSSYQDYLDLHEKFDHTGILEDIRGLIELQSDELSKIGLKIKMGVASLSNNQVSNAYRKVSAKFEQLRLDSISPQNFQDFVALGRILQALKHIDELTDSLHYATQKNRKIKKSMIGEEVMEANVSTDIKPAYFLSNLNLQSNVFRHSIRVAFAMFVGYYVSMIMHLTHNYWILLTILVILKPAYSMTKSRNKDRLFGTLLGILIGVSIIIFIKPKIILLLILVIFMVVTFSFLRTNYFLSVMAMTSYLVIFFFILNPENIEMVLEDRMLDTFIGSVIAFFVSLAIVPSWEHKTIKEAMGLYVQSATKYYLSLSTEFIQNHQQTFSKAMNNERREMMVALANLSDAFNRMLSEPKRIQVGTKEVHQFVSLSHTLTSHFSTLAFFIKTSFAKKNIPQLIPMVQDTRGLLTNIGQQLETDEIEPMQPNDEKRNEVELMLQSVLDRRKNEVEDGLLETETKKELVETKAIIDQFNYIHTLSGELAQIAHRLKIIK